MSTNTIETALIALAIIAFMTYRLSRWQTVGMSRLLRMPLVLLAAAVVSVAGSSSQLDQILRLSGTDLAILGFELGVGALAGWVIGRLTEIRTFPDGTKSRLTGPGIAVFLGFIALRIGLAVLAGALGGTLAATPAMALVVLALIKGIQSVMVWRRVQRHHDNERQREYAETWR